MTYAMADMLLTNPLLVGVLLGGVLGLAVVSSKVSGSAPSTSPQPNYRNKARAQVERIHGYDDLTDYQQAFLRECGADFLQRGYNLNTEINRLEVTTSNGPRACLMVTEDATIEMLAYDKSDGWQRIDSAPDESVESELKAKQKRLNEYF